VEAQPKQRRAELADEVKGVDASEPRTERYANRYPLVQIGDVAPEQQLYDQRDRTKTQT
jgi:hypothetical protein